MKQYEKPRIGVLGGTFDPPHLGHLSLATSALSHFNLTRLLWVLTPNSPKKTDTQITPVEHRINMVELALTKYTLFDLSLVDILRPGPYFAVNTLEILSQQNPETDLIYLFGSDLLNNFPNWVGVHRIVELCKSIGVAYRSDCSFDIYEIERNHPLLFSKIQFITLPPIDISSHRIKENLAEGKVTQDWLTPEVSEYIKIHSLYTLHG